MLLQGDVTDDRVSDTRKRLRESLKFIEALQTINDERKAHKERDVLLKLGEQLRCGSNKSISTVMFPTDGHQFRGILLRKRLLEVLFGLLHFAKALLIRDRRKPPVVSLSRPSDHSEISSQMNTTIDIRMDNASILQKAECSIRDCVIAIQPADGHARQIFWRDFLLQRLVEIHHHHADKLMLGRARCATKRLNLKDKR